MARSGLGRRTALGTATLVIGANLPDVDVLAYLDGPAADLSFRRGWTHGIPALVILPFVLTGAVMLFDRLVRRMGRAVLPSTVKPGQVLLLAVLSIVSHPLLDTLNTYGVRWLMPLRGDWYYGDTLFIVDPWLWLMLAVGVVASPRGRARPATIALVASGCYVVGMALSATAARRIARRELTALGGPVDRLMVAPRPISPFSRQVVAAQGGRYVTGSFRWFASPHVETASMRSYPRPLPNEPLLARARILTLGRRFLGWARFPIVRADTSSAGDVVVHLIDLRYTDRRGAGFGSVTLPLGQADAISSTSSYSESARPRRTPP